MALELSKHKDIVSRMQHMIALLKIYQFDIDINSQIDDSVYLQKIEEFRELQNQIERASSRVYELRLLLHNESHKMYNKIKADSRIIKKRRQRKLVA